jgi:UDP-N-acetylmuramate dehydrogenase
MNAGGRFGEIADVVSRVQVFRESDGPCWLDREDVGFAYRHTDLGDRIVIGAEFALEPDDPQAIRKRLLAAWAYKKKSQPLAAHSAGCIFRNPPGESAGRLIDQAGLKGLRCGAARVSDQHANFIVADEGATAGEVIELIRKVRDRVYERYEVRLELEIDLW